MKKTYEVKGMTCVICKASVEKAISSLEGVSCASVNLIENELTVDFDDNKCNDAQFEQVLKQAGFSIVKDHKKENIKEKARLIISGLLLIYLMILSMFFKGTQILQFLLSTTIICFHFNHLIVGWKALLQRNPNMESLIFVSCTASYLYSLIAYCFNTSSYYYFESAAMVLYIVSLGKFIEGNTKNKVSKVIRGLSTLIPMQANKLVNNEVEVIKIEALRKNDIVRVFPGESIPQDGVVVRGVSSIDESLITGEPLPQDKSINSNVIGGTVNLTGTLDIQVTKTSSTSTIAKIINLSKVANSEKTPIERNVDKIAKYFVSVVLIVSAITFVVWLIVSKNAELALNFALSTLVVSCPCALGLATPIALAVAGGVASKMGILVKKLEVLEIAFNTKNIIFDKTGTLTSSKLEIIDIKIFDKNFINILSSMEKNSLHPLSKTILEKYPDGNIQFDKVKYIASKGLKAKFKEDEYFAGRIELSDKYINNNADSYIAVTKNKKLLGIVYLKDKLRDSSISTINTLKEMNIDSLLCTGDNELAAKRLADTLKTEYAASLKPQDKSEVILNKKKRGITIMVGDGINDALAMNSADISCTIKEASDLASASSDIIIMNNDLNNVPKFIQLSKLTQKIIKENLIWALGYNTLFIPLAAGVFYPINGFGLNPIICSIAMWVSSSFVLLNALRINRFNKEENK